MDYEANFKGCEWVDEITVEDYPSGRHQTKCTWTVETKTAKKSGLTTQRVARVTVNPKTGQPCAPKKTTYASMVKLCQANDGMTYILELGEYGGLHLSLGTLCSVKTFHGSSDKPPTVLVDVFDLVAVRTPGGSDIYITKDILDHAISKGCTLVED